MSRNGSGTYNLPAGNPVTSGTTIQSTWANGTLSDIAAALTQSLSRDGQAAMSGPLPMGGQDIQNAGAITANGNMNAAAFVPTGSVAPANGMYLSAANTVAWATAATPRGTVNATGSWVINAPTNGIALTVTGLASGSSSDATFTHSSTDATPDNVNAPSFTLDNTATTAGNYSAIMFRGVDSGGAIHYGSMIGVQYSNRSAGGYDSTMFFQRRNQAGTVATALTLGPAGNVILNAPISGITLAITAAGAGGSALTLAGAATTFAHSYAGDTVARGIAVCKFKAGDTARTTSTMSNDPDLTYVIPGAGTYAVKVWAQFTGAAGNTGSNWNINYSGSFTAAVSAITEYHCIQAGVTLGVFSARSITNAQTTSLYSTASWSTTTPNDYTVMDAVLTATGGGTIAFSWASDNTHSVSVKQGSYMTVTQLS